MSGTDEKEDGHYSILQKISDKKVVLNDAIVEIDEFKKYWYDFDEEGRVDRWALLIRKSEGIPSNFEYDA